MVAVAEVMVVEALAVVVIVEVAEVTVIPAHFNDCVSSTQETCPNSIRDTFPSLRQARDSDGIHPTTDW